MVQRDQFVGELARAIEELLDQQDRMSTAARAAAQWTPFAADQYENALSARRRAAVRLARLIYDREASTGTEEDVSNGR